MIKISYELMSGRIGRIIKRLVSPERYARLIGVTLGQNNFIPDKEMWPSEPYLVSIGDNCQITMGVRLFTHGGGQVIRKFYPDFDAFGKINIGNNVYIGNNSLVMPGVTIGDNCLVGAGSVVSKSVPAGMVVAGVPAKIICTVEEYCERNLSYNLHCKGMSLTEKKTFLLTLDENCFIKKPNLC